jgi:hypothetical protein
MDDLISEIDLIVHLIFLNTFYAPSCWLATRYNL